MPNYTVTRTFHPVGQGACYSELFSDEQKPFWLVFYDFGTYQQNIGGVNVFDSILSKYNADIPVCVFISHFHRDHINGLPKLMNHFQQVQLYYPQLTIDLLLETFVTDPDIDKEPISDDYADLLENLAHPQAQGKNVPLSANSERYPSPTIPNSPISVEVVGDASNCHDSCDWVYIPYIIDNAKSHKFLEWFKNKFMPVEDNEPIGVRDLYNLVQKNVVECKEKYEEIWGGVNHSSMPVLSSNVTNTFPPATYACLYTGDLPVDPTICHNFSVKFQQFWRRLKILQVPHHGSKYNSCDQLFRPHLLCAISAGLSYRFHHPHFETLEMLTQQGSVPLLVTEEPKSIQTFIYNL